MEIRSLEFNPADVASRGVKFENFCRLEMWLSGPKYLAGLELELKRVTTLLSLDGDFKWLNELACRSPSWIALLRRVVWLTCFKSYLILKHLSRADASFDVGGVKVMQLLRATEDIFRSVQTERYGPGGSKPGWLMPKRNFVQGDLVLLCKDDAALGCWPKGIVIETYPGVDGIVRHVLVKTKGGPSRRDVRSLCLLEGAED